MAWQHDDDDFGFGARGKMAAAAFKPPPIPVAKSRYTNPIIQSKLHVIIEAGAKEFSGHEDVMAKFLGIKIKGE